MSSRRTASQIVAGFAANFDSSRLREAHVLRVGRALADTMAVAIAAQNEPVVRRACHYIETLTLPLTDGRGGRHSRMASLWGRGQQSTVEGAALFNGIAAHALDFDDASSPMSGHPSIALLPCLIALAEVRHIEGIRVASAYVVGFEVCCKLGRALDLTHYSRGWHMTATMGRSVRLRRAVIFWDLMLSGSRIPSVLRWRRQAARGRTSGLTPRRFRPGRPTQPRSGLSCWLSKGLRHHRMRSTAEPGSPSFIQVERTSLRCWRHSEASRSRSTAAASRSRNIRRATAFIGRWTVCSI